MDYLIAAGGTGQEIASAVLRLTYLAGLDFPQIRVVDSDLAHGKSRATRAQVFADLKTVLYDHADLKTDWVSELNPIYGSAPEQAPSSSSNIAPRTIVDMFTSQGVLAHEQDRLLLDVLLTQEQKEVTINDGFHGQPAVGSIAFSRQLVSGSLDDLIKELDEHCAQQKGLRVVFAGSISGGMGTSVLPPLIERISELKQGQRNLRTFALLQLPWFQLETEDANLKADVDFGRMERNAACMIRRYLQSVLEESLDGVVPLGLPEPARRVSDGGNSQRETLHFLCLVSGIYATNLLSKRRTREMFPGRGEGIGFQGGTLGRDRGVYGGLAQGPQIYGKDPNKPLTVGRLVDVARGLESLTSSIQFELMSLKPRASHSAVIHKILKRLKDPDERKSFKKTIDGLHNLHVGITAWLRGCLQSEAGKGPASDKNPFVVDDWDKRFESSTRAALDLLDAKTPWFSVNRRLLGQLALTDPGKAHKGRQTAWNLVRQARARLVGGMAA